MDCIIEYLVNHNNTSMSVYYAHNSNQRLFQFRNVTNYDNIILSWIYNQFIICYCNTTLDINIKQIGSYTMSQTLCFGNVLFHKLIYDAIEIYKHKRRKQHDIKKQCIINTIKDYFIFDNEILIYRPSLIELNIKINERQKPPNHICCVCLEHKYIESKLFNCSHQELCFDCFCRLNGNICCPICRSN
jgi:hypothetical protein